MPQRVVSLIPSATEIVCALGLGERLVGRSHECDHPPGVRRLPVLTEAKIDLAGSSRAIDERVRALLQDALSVYRVYEDRLRALRPDVVLTQSHCEVCAVSLADVEGAVCSWLEGRPTLVALEPNALGDVWDDIRRVAGALRAEAEGEALVRRLKRRMRAVAARVPAATRPPRVACVEWIDPLMAAGNWVPTLVEKAGGAPLFGAAGAHSPYLSWDDLRAADPDVIVVMPCGFGLERTQRELPALTQRSGWADLRAVQEGRVVLTDGNHYFNRPGPRLAESLEILAEVLHPQHVAARHRGTGWRPWAASAAPSASHMKKAAMSPAALNLNVCTFQENEKDGGR